MMHQYSKILRQLGLAISLILALSPNQNAKASTCQDSELSPPSWVQQLSAKGRRFNYYIGQSSASNFSDAFQGALGHALTTIKSEEQVEIESILENIETMKAQGDQIEEAQQATSYIKAKARGIVKGAKIQDSFVEVKCSQDDKRFTVYLLVKTKKKRIDRSVPLPITKGSTVWRSAILPGWGQIHRGHESKGYWLMSSTLVSLAGGIVLNQLAQSNYTQASQSMILADREFYDQQGRTFNYIAWGLFATSASVYLYNLFDAGTREPAKQYYAHFGLKPNSNGVMAWSSFEW